MGNRLRLIGFCLAAGLASFAPAAGAQGTCSDDFGAATLGAAWRFLDKDGAAGGGYALQGGRLELTGRGRDVFRDVNEYVAVRRSDLAGDFDVSVKLESQANTHAWAQAGILAAANLDSLGKGGYVAVDASPGNGYTLFYDAAEPAGSLDKYVKAEAAPAYPVWLRLAKRGKAFSAWYRNRADAPWIPIAADVAPVGAAAPSQVVLFSLSHDAAKDGKAVFDDFACLHAAPAAIRRPEPARVSARSDRARAGTRSAAGRRATGRMLFHRP